MAKLKEGAIGQPGKISTLGKGQLSVVVTPLREGKEGGSLGPYIEVAEAVLRRLAESHKGGQQS